MAITNYSELQTAVQNLFDDSSSLSSVRVVEHIAQGEALINRQVRGREMETSADLTISSQTTALPTGFLKARRLYLNTDPIKTIQYMPPMDFWNRSGADQTGTPDFFTIEGDNVVVGPVPTSSVTGKLLYYKRSDIASAVPTLFTNNPDMYLYASGIYSSIFLRDDAMLMRCTGMFEQIVNDYGEADEGDRHGGAPLAMRTDVGVDG